MGLEVIGGKNRVRGDAVGVEADETSPPRVGEPYFCTESSSICFFFVGGVVVSDLANKGLLRHTDQQNKTGKV